MESKVGILDGGVHVLPECRRQHIGAALLLNALQWLRNHGMKTAMVTPFNPEGEDATQRAIAFCNSTGGKMSEDLASQVSISSLVCELINSENPFTCGGCLV